MMGLAEPAPGHQVAETEKTNKQTKKYIKPNSLIIFT